MHIQLQFFCDICFRYFRVTVVDEMLPMITNFINYPIYSCLLII